MKLNGTTITGYTKSPYRPDTTTGVLCDAIKTLEALKKVNPNIEYTIQTDVDVLSYTQIWLTDCSIHRRFERQFTQIDISKRFRLTFLNKGC